MIWRTAGGPERRGSRPDSSATAPEPPLLSDTCLALAELEPDGWSVLHDLHRPGSDRAGIERIAVGPGGILVMQTLPGHGEVTVVDGTLRVRGYARTPDAATVAEAAGAVTALLAPEHRRLVRPVLVLDGQDLPPTGVRGGARAVGVHRLAGHLRGMAPVLPLAELPLVVDYLAAELGDDTSPEQLTVDDVLHGGPVPVAPRSTEPVRAPEPMPASPVARPTGAGDRALRWGTLGLLLATVINVLLAVLGA